MPENYVNIIIAKRDRTEQLLTCLYYLNLANADKRFNVEVYIAEDTEFCVPIKLSYEYIKVFNYNVERKNNLFNKSRLFNYAISQARKNFDWMSIVDIDMVYSDKFFYEILCLINSEYNYIVSHGYKLAQAETEFIMRTRPNISDIKRYPKEEFIVGPSQITITKPVLDLFIDLFGPKFYDEYYEGWGAEDSDHSFKSMMLYAKKKIKKADLNKQWYHLWHTSAYVNQGQYEKNFKYFQSQVDKAREIVNNKFGG
jgi:hypothetical protein